MLNNILNGYQPLIIKLGVIFLLVFCSTFVLSQNETPKSAKVPMDVVCGDTSTFIKVVKEAGEIPFAFAQQTDGKTITSIWVNPKTQTFTIGLSFKEDPNVTCMVLEGTKFTIFAKSTHI